LKAAEISKETISTETSASNTSLPSRTERRTAAAFGCLTAMVSAVLTCGLLFVNGSLVLAVLESLEESGLSLVRGEGFSQFMLFAMPVGLVVIQWMMIDYVRTRFSQRR
jgi:predicted ABC-type sugar transport system permease subunit